MKKFIEGLKNILYDSMDYIIMLAIVISVVSVIGWRLDILFAKDIKPVDNETMPVQDIVADEGEDTGSSEDMEANPDEEDTSQEGESPDKEDTLEADPDSDKDKKNPEKDDSQSITINIPDGSLPSGIGSILEANGLVPSKNEFVTKAQDMDLDRSLRSGEYTFDKNSSLEDIIRVIARK